jgi:hypothetical protein
MKTKAFFALLLTILVIVYSCSKKDNGGGINPSASFTLSEVAGNSHAPSTANFINTSTNGASYSWSFGDGGSSSVDAPSHKYTAAGQSVFAGFSQLKDNNRRSIVVS